MATITNGTNYIEFDGTLAVPKDQITSVKKKSGKIVLFREAEGPIEINPDDVTSPSFADIDDLYSIIKGYL